MKIDATQAATRVCVCASVCVGVCCCVSLMIDDVHISSNKHKTRFAKKKADENQQVVYVISCRRGRAGSRSLVFAYLSSFCAECVYLLLLLVCVFFVCDIHLKIPLDATPITTRRSRGSTSRCEANLISGSVKHTNCS